MSANTQEAIEIALQFARALAQRDYALAHTLTTLEYQGNTSLNEVQGEYERIVPHDWGDIEILSPEDDDEMLEDWPDKQPPDIGWIYVGLAGSNKYHWTEGLYILISQEDSSLKVREVEFGRP